MADTQEEAERDARPGMNAHHDITFGLSPNWGRDGIVAANEKLTNEENELGDEESIKNSEYPIKSINHFI